MNIVDSSYEELLLGEDSGFNHKELSNNPLNTKIKFLSDSFSSGDDDKEEEGEEAKEEKNHKSDTSKDASTNHDDTIGGISDLHKIDDVQSHNLTEEKPNENKGKVENHENEEKEAHNPPAKKQCLKIDATKCDFNEEENKSIDKLIEAELKELGDKNKTWRCDPLNVSHLSELDTWRPGVLEPCKIEDESRIRGELPRSSDE